MLNKLQKKSKQIDVVEYRPTRHIIGHFGDESSQIINCTGTDNEKVTNKTKHAPKNQQNDTETCPV